MLCIYGCGNEGIFQLKNGNWICQDSKNKCPALKKKNSLGGRNYKKHKCNYCKKEYVQVSLHEKTCYLNPENLLLCPVCGEPIKNYKNNKTCSHRCANNLFKRVGEYHWNFQNGGEKNYRKICFDNHGNKCIICGEENIVQAHHIDTDRENNSPENLVPLCLNHHWYMHTEFKVLIENQVLDYIKHYKKYGPVAQLGECCPCKAEVKGSIPFWSTI